MREGAADLYRLLAENATDLVSTHRSDGTFDYATPSWLEYLGLSPVGVLPGDFCHPDDVELLTTNHRLAFNSNNPLTTLWRCRHKDGSYGWLETKARAVRDDQNARATMLICTTRDVTERRRLQEEFEMLHEIVLAVTSAPSLDVAIQIALRQLCETTGWSYGEVWFPTADGSAIARSPVWYQRADTDAASLAAVSVGLMLLPDEEAPGRAWTSGKIVRDQNSPRAMRHDLVRVAGFETEVAIPVTSDGLVVAVLHFMMPTSAAADPARIAFVSVVCAQLGAVIARNRIDQVRAEERQFLSALLDSLSEGIIACDADGRLTVINRATREQQGLLDFAAEATSARGPRRPELLHVNGHKLSEDEWPIMRVMSGAEVRDMEFVVETGPGHRRTLSANGRLIVDDDGRHLGAVVATRDVTDRNRAREALEKSEARFRAASDGGLDMFFIFEAVRDTDDRIVDFIYADVNARATATLGKRRDDLLGRRLSHVYPNTVKSGYLAKFIDVALTRVPLEEEIEMSVPGFDGRWAWNQVVPLGDGVAVTSRDITHRKELERMKDEFLSVVSHELRTPLTSIRGALGLVSSGRLAQAPAKAQRMMDLAVDNADRLIRLINDILDVERINAGKISIVRDWCDGADLARSVVDTLRPVAERAGVELTMSGEQLRIFADADRVTQTLTNLLGNAIKFSPRGSRVETTAHLYRGTALFEVRDYGRGIPVHKLETIFDRFAQVDASDAREKGGTGLGLAICRGIVRQHGGRIWAELPDGGGSLFRFTIPLSAQHQVVA